MTHRKVFLIMKQNETGLQTVSAAQWQLNEVMQAIRRETISVLHVLYSTFRSSFESIIKEYAEIIERRDKCHSHAMLPNACNYCTVHLKYVRFFLKEVLLKYL
jgi:hypothetical protein